MVVSTHTIAHFEDKQTGILNLINNVASGGYFLVQATGDDIDLVKHMCRDLSLVQEVSYRGCISRLYNKYVNDTSLVNNKLAMFFIEKISRLLSFFDRFGATEDCLMLYMKK